MLRAMSHAIPDNRTICSALRTEQRARGASVAPCPGASSHNARNIAITFVCTRAFVLRCRIGPVLRATNCPSLLPACSVLAHHFMVGIAICNSDLPSRQLEVTVFHLVWKVTAPLP